MLAVLAGTVRSGAASLDLVGLSRLLHLSAGVVRTGKRDWGTHLFRAAGSAGGRFPLELYVAIPDGVPGMPPGVHWYDPVQHALVQVGPPPGQNSPNTQAATVIVTGVPWRTGWRYRERGFRHVYWDAGTVLSQLLALADSAGFTSRLHTRFPDADISALIGADLVHEWPVALGAGASSMTFLDSEFPTLLGGQNPAADDNPLDGLIFTCVGVPANTSKPAGLPGTPTEIRRVSPREQGR